MLRAVADAIQVSKLRWRLVDDTLKPLSLEEAFYMATMGGGAFFGKVGSFLEGYEFDALILDDSSSSAIRSTLSARERLERLVIFQTITASPESMFPETKSFSARSAQYEGGNFYES